MEYLTQKELGRLNSGWVKSGDCHLWKRFLDKDGYGSFYFRKKLRRVHRVSYFSKYGSIADGLVVDHVCKNRNCIFVDHLRLVTTAENSLHNSNSVGAINKAKTSCKFGHPFDKIYGKQRYCSICMSEKTKRLRKKWKAEANLVKC